MTQTSCIELEQKFFEEIKYLLHQEKFFRTTGGIYSRTAEEALDRVYDIVNNEAKSGFCLPGGVNDYAMIQILSNDINGHQIRQPLDSVVPLVYKGESQFDFSYYYKNHLWGLYGMNQRQSIEKIVNLIKQMNIDNFSKFSNYYQRLSSEFRENLEFEFDVNWNKTEVEVLWEDFELLVNFYLKIENNNTWVFIDHN